MIATHARKHPFAAAAVVLAVLGLSVPAAVAVTGGGSRPTLAPSPATTSAPSDDATSDAVDRSSATTSTVPGAGATVDVSGPCDEAEHANDPRCTGVAPPAGGGGGADDDGAHGDRDDNRGPGSRDDRDEDEDDDEDDDRDEDRSGPNRGQG